MGESMTHERGNHEAAPAFWRKVGPVSHICQLFKNAKNLIISCKKKNLLIIKLIIILNAVEAK